MTRPDCLLRVMLWDGTVLAEGDAVPPGVDGFIVSPCNPNYEQLSFDENRTRIFQFPQPAGSMPVLTTGEGHGEVAFYVPVSAEEAERLARMFGQAAYFALPAGGVVRVVCL